MIPSAALAESVRHTALMSAADVLDGIMSRETMLEFAASHFRILVKCDREPIAAHVVDDLTSLAYCAKRDGYLTCSELATVLAWLR